MKMPSSIKSSKIWRLKAAVNGMKKASQHWQEYSSDKLVTNMLFPQNDINPSICKRFFVTIWSATTAKDKNEWRGSRVTSNDASDAC